MDPLLEEYGSRIREIAARRGIENVRVFGSMARGDAHPESDIDLLVSLPPGRSGLALGGLLMDVQELTGRKVDVVTEASLHPSLRQRVLLEAIPL
jgi:predicted nucleotidyltransferase